MDRRITPRLVAVSLLVGLIFAALPVMAGDDSWTVAGLPAGGAVYQLVVDPVTPSNLYAVSGPGVFKSADSGATWTLVFRTLNPASDLVIEPENPSVLYVAYGGDAQKTLFKTTDGGQTWNEADNGIGMISSFQIDGVYRIAVDPVNDGVAYATTYNTGVFKTTDHGANWHAINTGVSALLGNLNVELNHLMVDPVDPRRVYLGVLEYLSPTNGSTALAGLYVSTDSGGTWNPSGWIGSNLGTTFVMDPSDHTHLLTCSAGNYIGAKLVSSADSGATWTAGAACPYETSALAINPTDSQHIYIGTYNAGLYESTNGGTTQNLVSGFGSDYITDLTFDTGTVASPATPPNLYVSTGSWGVFQGSSGGSTWSPISQGSQGIYNVQVNQMLMGADGILYLASGGSGVYKSPDQGVTWTEVGASLVGPTGGDVGANSLIEDPTANSTLYAGTADSVFKTIDGGSTWNRSVFGMPTNPTVYGLALDPQQPGIIYAGLAWGEGVYKSVDGGATWSSADSGISLGPNWAGGAGTSIYAVATDAQQSGVVYVGTDIGVYKTTDGGASWGPSRNGIGDPWTLAVAVNPSNSNDVYASTATGFYKSTDGGATWIASNTGLNGYLMTTIQIDPNQPSNIYLSENYPIGYGQAGYVFMSTDGGDTWNPLIDGASTASVTRSTRSIRPLPAQTNATTIPVAFSNVVVDPKHVGRLFASGNDGRIYTYDNVGKSSGSTSGSGSGGTGGTSSGATGSGSGGGGGGSFGLLLILGLTGLALVRRR